DPSRFLNEVPFELIENLSTGPSWLGFHPNARRDGQDAAPSRGDSTRAVKKTSNYSGKTYNSVESVRDFFKRKVGEADHGDDAPRKSEPGPSGQGERKKAPSARPHSGSGGDLRAGVRVRHAKYGVGVVLRTEGSGD